jgi:micrococcal nuclease
MVFGKVVEVQTMGKDRYGRMIALVAVNKQLLNEELVRAGYGWVYYTYCNEMIGENWKALQLEAKIDKRGLWADPEAIPPWEFRKTSRGK